MKTRDFRGNFGAELLRQVMPEFKGVTCPGDLHEIVVAAALATPEQLAAASSAAWAKTMAPIDDILRKLVTVPGTARVEPVHERPATEYDLQVLDSVLGDIIQ